jgi:general transcriptional corepressor TUP1
MVTNESSGSATDNTGFLAPISENSSFLDDLDPLSVPPELKKEGSDWFAIFNPKIKRALDVNLVHTLHHERCDGQSPNVLVIDADVAPHGNSVVCCVKFSADGKYLATGCNRAAQIFDAKTGAKTWCVRSLWLTSALTPVTLAFLVPNSVLVDDKANKYGDLYIRSVCFSPDGKYLATGAEDRQIRVCYLIHRIISSILVNHPISYVSNIDLGHRETAHPQRL